MKKLSLLLAVLLIVSAMPSFALGDVTKKEVVYTKIGAEGQIETVSVMNIFQVDKDISFTDYGNYQSTKNLSTTQELVKQNDAIDLNLKQGLFYYQGNGPKAALPWNFRFSYELDGKAILPADLAGQSGHIKIIGDITKDPAANEAFFNNYLLQLTLTFPMENFRLISAEGATIAVEGSNSLLNYTVLPSKEAHIIVEAEVSDFEMEPMQITGLPFNMNFDMPNISDYTKDIVKLQGAIGLINSGTEGLSGGLVSLSRNGLSLKTGFGAILEGLRSLNSGSSKLTGGLTAYQSGLSDYSSGVSSYTKGVDQLIASLSGLSSQMQGLAEYVRGVRQFAGGVQQAAGSVQAGLDAYNLQKPQIDGLVSAGTNLLSASSQIQSGLSQLAGAVSPTQLDQLKQGSQAFYEGLLQLKDGANGSRSGLSTSISSLQGIAQGLRASADSLATIDASGLSPEDQGKLTANITAIRTSATAIEQIADGLSQIDQILMASAALADQYQSLNSGIQAIDLSALAGGLSQLSLNYERFQTGLSSYTDGVSQMVTNLNETMAGLSGLTALSDGAAKIQTASDQIQQGLSTGGMDGLSGLTDAGSKLRSGGSLLVSNFTSIIGGVQQFASGLSQLISALTRYQSGLESYLEGVDAASSGATKLAEGTGQLKEGTDQMDETIKEQIESQLDSYTSGDFTPVSFVSVKNKNISEVQFVFLSDAIKPAEPEKTAPALEEPEGFFDRLLNIFR